ncbi:unnamed protein product [Symbiodinium sp. CCMP2592]|nr:unnamed protein product [Symbiodinium sp. CCMP2592]CAE7547973.1 unnamed protein product [Symbiodinium sp. CCMP2592]
MVVRPREKLSDSVVLKDRPRRHRAADLRAATSGPKVSVSVSEVPRKKAARQDEDGMTAMQKFRIRGKTWQMSVGSHSENGSRTVWLEERCRPKWGLGCVLCAQMVLRLQLDKGSAKMRRSYSTKWSRFEIDGIASMQTCAFKKHSQSDQHMAAWRLFRLPAQAQVFATPSCDSDLDLLKGSVPQPSDWLSVWSDTVRVNLSSRGSTRSSLTQQFISSNRLQVKEVERRAIAQMRLILRECVREKKRQQLQQARSICLSLDDKGFSPYRLLRFKCCTADGQVFGGIVGCMHSSKLLLDNPEKWEEDKSVSAAATVHHLVEVFCTPMGSDQPDEGLMQVFRNNVRSFCADGCPYVQKVGRVLRSRYYPKIVLLSRDMAHMLRCSYQPPLAADPKQEELWGLINSGDGSLFPALQHSHEWRARLMTLNRSVLEKDGAIHNILRSNLRRFIYLLTPIALLMAMTAADQRTGVQLRAKCHKLLAGMRPGLLIALGLAADFGSEVTGFLREWEKDFDVATVHRRIAAFKAKITSLFLEARIFDELQDVPDEEQSSVVLAAKHAMQTPEIQVNGKVYNVWPSGSGRMPEVQETVSSFQVTTQAFLGRVAAELPDQEMKMTLRALDLVLWRKSSTVGKVNLEVLVRLWLKDLGMDHDQQTVGIQQYRDAAPGPKNVTLGLHDIMGFLDLSCPNSTERGSYLCSKHTDKEIGNDNRGIWATVMDKNWTVLNVLLSFYLSLEVSSCTLERNFSELRRFVESHCGASQSESQDIEAALELRLDGPQDEAEVCRRTFPEQGPGLLQLSKKVQVALAVPGSGSGSPLLELNAFSKRLAELWIHHHGRRFHVYKRRQDCGLRRGPREGTESSLIAAQKRARSKLSQGLGVDSRQLFGAKRSKLAWKAAGCLEDSEIYKQNESMKVFHERSATIKEKHLDVRRAKIDGSEPYPVGGLY